MLIITDEACQDYHREGHPERPQRIGASIEFLRRQEVLTLDWRRPELDPSAAIARLHPAAHLERLEAARADFDADTPAHHDIAAHARRSVSGALEALAAADRGERAFVLLRPPGHHALAAEAMGFCYLNQAAIVTATVAAGGRRAALIDFDVHHGNGSEALLLGRDGCFYASVHQYPAYPGTGAQSRANCSNHPIRPGSAARVYADGFRAALDAVLDFRPDMLVVSAGFDAYRGDPLAQENLEAEDYRDFGALLAATGLPLVSLLEGGYSEELPQLILAYLEGLEGGA
ncbi:MAG: histone deacetylase [Planctomycetes bacterium]|nr:histone deacetylase [Planctomycetota bacterium]